MRFIIRTALSAIVSVSAATYALAEPGPTRVTARRAPSAAVTAQQPDSIVWQRLPKDRKLPPGMKLVPETKLRAIGQGALLDTMLVRMRASGFFDLTSAQVADACGNPGTSVSRWSLRVLDGGAWRELVIPDDCAPAAPDLSARMTELRSLGWELWTGRLH
jgi:hypothetical protein